MSVAERGGPGPTDPRPPVPPQVTGFLGCPGLDSEHSSECLASCFVAWGPQEAGRAWDYTVSSHELSPPDAVALKAGPGHLHSVTHPRSSVPVKILPAQLKITRGITQFGPSVQRPPWMLLISAWSSRERRSPVHSQTVAGGVGGRCRRRGGGIACTAHVLYRRGVHPHPASGSISS